MRIWLEKRREYAQPSPRTHRQVRKETYLKGNVTPRPLSDGMIDVIPWIEGPSVRHPTRRETISMLQDLHRLGGVKQRLSSWHDPFKGTVLRIFILAWHKNQVKSVPKEVLC